MYEIDEDDLFVYVLQVWRIDTNGWAGHSNN
jgi:hypothetical protein